jgi:hypothetical protein
MPARIRSRFSNRAQIVVTDLSPNGCRILAKEGELCDDQLAFIRLDQLEPWRARIRWRHFQVAGLEFDRTLYLPVVEHLANHWKPQAPSSNKPRSFALLAPA